MSPQFDSVAGLELPTRPSPFRAASQPPSSNRSMVRLVFRPYTQVLRSICTSEPLRASTRVSSGFALLRNSSPSFGSQRTRSTARPSVNFRLGRRCPREGYRLSLSLRVRVFHPNTREHVALLGPCFKTGRLKPLRQHPRLAPDPSVPGGIRDGGLYHGRSRHLPLASVCRSKPMLAGQTAKCAKQKQG